MTKEPQKSKSVPDYCKPSGTTCQHRSNICMRSMAHDSAYIPKAVIERGKCIMRIRSLPLTMAQERRALREAVGTRALQVSQARGFSRLLANAVGTCVMASTSDWTACAMVYSACGVFRTVDPTCSEWSTLALQTIPEVAISPGQLALWRLSIDGIGREAAGGVFLHTCVACARRPNCF